jgi:predicted TIM-barrel fold metal-dependent hydrolase
LEVVVSAEEKVLIVSADGHVGPPLSHYVPYFEPSMREEAAALLADEEAVFLQGRPADASMGSLPDAAELTLEQEWEMDSPLRYGAWNAEMRLGQLDRQGVVAEVLVPGHQFATLPLFSVMNRPYSAELRDAGYKAYHRWLADFCSQSDGRLLGMGDPGPCLDMDDAVQELHWTKAQGFACVGVPGIIEDPALPPLSDSHYDPFWKACADDDMALLIHAGWGFPQGRFQDFLAKFLVTHHGAKVAADVIATRAQLDPEAAAALSKEYNESPASPLRLDYGPRRLLWQLMLAGVFDRYPTLRFVLTEVRSDWIPATLHALDGWYEEAGRPLKRRPSEYWASHCYATPSSIHKAEVENRHAVGVGNLMFGMDYPHPEATWPDTWNWIRDAFAGVAEDEMRAILGENAVKCFALDRPKLAAIAERIGPMPSELLGPDHHVRQDHIQHFHQRAGYSREVEPVDTDSVRELVREDARLLLAK